MQEDAKILRDTIEMLVNDLGDLYLLIDTVALGLEAEQTEPQVTACLNSICKCIEFIKYRAKNSLVKVEDVGKEQGHE